ncbi:ImuA family protein [Roseobacter sp. A03A-229]
MKHQARVQQVTLSEVFPQTVTDAGSIGFVLSRLPKTSAPVLWVQDRLSCKEAGRPYLPGLGAQPQVIWVNVSRPADVLWSMEEGLRCSALSAVIGEVWGDPPALDFTATKRLALRAEAAGVACWLIRRATAPGLSAARERWRVGSLPSAAHPDDVHAPGAPRWQAELFKSRTRKPGTWALTHDRASDRVDILAPVRDGAVAENNGARRKRAL